MNRLLYHGILLAERSHLESLAKRFRGRQVRFDRDDAVTGLLILAGLALAIWILSYVVGLQDRHRSRPSPLRLFFSLCRAHRLPWPQGWLLWRVARAQRLRDPARLFLEPERLEAACLARSFRKYHSLLQQIRERLFERFEQRTEDGGSETLASEPSPPSEPSLPTIPSPALDIASLTSLPWFDVDISNVDSISNIDSPGQPEP